MMLFLMPKQNNEENMIRKHIKPPQIELPPKPVKPERGEEPKDAPLPPLPELPKNLDDMREQLNQLDKEIHMLQERWSQKKR